MSTTTGSTITGPKVSRTAPKVTVNGTELTAAQFRDLISVRVEQSLGLPTRVTLRFRDLGHAMAKSSTFNLGTAVVVKIDTTTVATVYVTGISANRPRGGAPEYVVTADDNAYKLTRGVTPTVYQSMSPSDVISQLASAAGLTASVSSSAKLSTTQDYQLQTGTAMAYLNALCRRAGAIWWVSPSDGTTLNVKAPNENGGTASKNVNNDFVEFSLRASGLTPTEVEVDGWDPTSTAAVTGDASSATARGTKPTLISSYLGSPLPTAKSSFASYNPGTSTDATNIATALLNDATDSAVIARGTSYADPDLAVGVQLTLANSDVYNGDYFISEVEHFYSKSGFYTSIVAGPHRSIDIVDTLGNPEEDPGISYSGLMVAKVSKNTGDPKNIGRIQVQYLAQPGTLLSNWARILGLGSGSSMGVMFHPIVGDEVLIGFENNDINRPVVLGSLWNSNNVPDASTLPDSNGKIAARQIASVAGHIFEFGEDTSDPAKEHIKMVVKSGQTLRIGADKVTLDTSNKPLEFTAGNASIKFDDQGNITISGVKVTIKGTQEVDLAGPTISIKADTQLGLESSAQAALKGAQTEIDGNGQLTLKGGLVQIN